MMVMAMISNNNNKHNNHARSMLLVPVVFIIIIIAILHHSGRIVHVVYADSAPEAKDSIPPANPLLLSSSSFVLPLRSELHAHQRWLEDGEKEDNEEEENESGEEEDEEEDEEEEEEDQEEQEEEQEEEEDRNNNNNQGPGHDDFFTDDFTTNDDDSSGNGRTEVDDAYYAYEIDRTPRLFPLETNTVVGFFVASLALTMGATSGTGGGGILVPIYILIIGLPVHMAVPIGAATVLGGSIASTSMNWSRRHPLADRVLIDWDLVLVMEPLTLVGALVGALLHRMLSEKVLVVLLVLLLSVTAYTTLAKAFRMYQAENRYIRQLKTSNSSVRSSNSENGHHEKSSSSSPSFPQIQNWGTMDPAETESLQYTDMRIEMTNSSINKFSSPKRLHPEEKEEILILNPDYVTLRSELIQQEKFTPRSKIIALCLMFFVLTFLNVMVGGGAYESPLNIDCGSTAFWVVHFIMIAFLVASAWAAQTYVVARHEIKELVRFDYVHGDIKWDARSAILYPTVFVTAGLFAGTLGIGGGVITVPIMLAMGVHPGVVAATSSAMILFTSFAATTSFVIFRMVVFPFAILAFCCGFCATLLGQIIMRRARKARSASGRDFERNSFTAFAIGGVVLVSALLMTIEYIFSMLRQREDADIALCTGFRF